MSPHPQARSYDVVVIGGGPAGATAAAVLAQAGLKVAIVDKFSFPRDKACGDVIGPKAVWALDNLGLSCPLGVPISDMEVIFPNAKRMILPSEKSLDLNGVGRAVRRKELDDHLLSQALSRGANFVPGRLDSLDAHPDGEVTVFVGGTNPTTIRAKFLIGADGSTSTVADLLGLLDPRRILWGFAIRSYIRATLERPAISLLSRKEGLFPGYGWAFPSTEGELNVGVGVGLEDNRRGSALATRSLQGYIDQLQSTGIISTLAGGEVAKVGGWIKMGMTGTTPAKYRTLLVGDAAGLVNPLQGEGIAQAIESGAAAARAIVSARNDPSVAYASYLREEHLSYQRAAGMVHRLALRYPVPALSAIKELSSPKVNRGLAPAWGIYWNDLTNAVGPMRGSRLARVASVSLDVTRRLGTWVGSDL